MASRRHATLAAVGVVLLWLVLAVVIIEPTVLAPTADAYERRTIDIGADEPLCVRVADTPRKRYVGLSDTASLDRGEGMLFVHDSDSEHTYVMRDMEFPIDIVFITANGTVTSIHHAPRQADGRWERRYTGSGQYVLEVPYGYTNETGLQPGDRIEVGEG